MAYAWEGIWDRLLLLWHSDEISTALEHTSHRWSGSGHTNWRHNEKHTKKEKIYYIHVLWLMIGIPLKKRDKWYPQEGQPRGFNDYTYHLVSLNTYGMWICPANKTPTAWYSQAPFTEAVGRCKLTSPSDKDMDVRQGNLILLVMGI